MITRLLAAVLLCFLAVLACSVDDSSAASLKANVSSVCNPNRHLFVSSIDDGRFRFNAAVLDSGQLVRAFQNVLPPHPNKVVMVSLSTVTAGQEAWIVKAINASGGQAYKPDAVCLPSASSAAFFAR
jgi:hypothetical protein